MHGIGAPNIVVQDLTCAVMKLALKTQNFLFSPFSGLEDTSITRKFKIGLPK
jgi:hypothetical protein